MDASASGGPERQRRAGVGGECGTMEVVKPQMKQTGSSKE